MLNILGWAGFVIVVIAAAGLYLAALSGSLLLLLDGIKDGDAGTTVIGGLLIIMQVGAALLAVATMLQAA